MNAAAKGLRISKPCIAWAWARDKNISANALAATGSANSEIKIKYDDDTKVYQAPLQLKANGGTLIIDDFGRQQMSAVQLLNRWIVALEGGIDHLTMHTGQTIEVPFEIKP